MCQADLLACESKWNSSWYCKKTSKNCKYLVNLCFLSFNLIYLYLLNSLSFHFSDKNPDVDIVRKITKNRAIKNNRIRIFITSVFIKKQTSTKLRVKTFWELCLGSPWRLITFRMNTLFIKTLLKFYKYSIYPSVHIAQAFQ